MLCCILVSGNTFSRSNYGLAADSIVVYIVASMHISHHFPSLRVLPQIPESDHAPLFFKVALSSALPSLPSPPFVPSPLTSLLLPHSFSWPRFCTGAFHRFVTSLSFFSQLSFIISLATLASQAALLLHGSLTSVLASVFPAVPHLPGLPFHQSSFAFSCRAARLATLRARRICLSFHATVTLRRSYLSLNRSRRLAWQHAHALSFSPSPVAPLLAFGARSCTTLLLCLLLTPPGALIIVVHSTLPPLTPHRFLPLCPFFCACPSLRPHFHVPPLQAPRCLGCHEAPSCSKCL